MSALLEPPAEAATERLERLIVEQGVSETATSEHLAKTGHGLFESDEEFEEWMALLDRLRRNSPERTPVTFD